LETVIFAVIVPVVIRQAEQHDAVKQGEGLLGLRHLSVAARNKPFGVEKNGGPK
jgi:hypothetical protein